MSTLEQAAPAASSAPSQPKVWHSARRYVRSALRDDLLAAIIVTVLLVPQSLAYALLAGLPPVVGVMASLLPIVAYAAFGSSNTLAVGPVAVLAMMTAQVIVPAAATHGVSPHLAAMVLAFLIAAVLLLAMALRLEVFAALLSAPVLHGFIAGAAIVIAIGQLPALLGIAARGHTLLELGASLSSMPTAWPHPATAAIGLSALALLWALRRWAVKFFRAVALSQGTAHLLARMAPMLVVGLALAWVAGLPQQAQGVARAGSVNLAQGLSFPSLFAAPAGLWLDLWVPAVLLGLVAYVESLAVAEALAARRGEKVLPRRELMGLSMANAAAGLSGGMPVTGGFARSIVNFDAGARTRMAGVWTALLLGALVWAFGDVLAHLPRAVLAATIIVAVLSLLDSAPFVLAWRYSRGEFALMAGVAALTVLVGIEPALLAGVLVSVGMLLQRTARPHWAEVGRIPGTEVYRNVKRFQVLTDPAVMTVRIDESLLFTNSRWLSQQLSELAASRGGLRHLVLMMSGVNDVDLTGLEGLQQLTEDLKVSGVQLHLSEVKGPVRDRLDAAGCARWLTGRMFQTHADAMRELGGPDVQASE